MTPYNAIDMARLRKLLDLAEECRACRGLNVYVSDPGSAGNAYVRLEVDADLPADRVREIFALSIETLLSGESK